MRDSLANGRVLEKNDLELSSTGGELTRTE
jgi:hypothetical protein